VPRLEPAISRLQHPQFNLRLDCVSFPFVPVHRFASLSVFLGSRLLATVVPVTVDWFAIGRGEGTVG
jgi:hypothetical protein